MGERKVQSKIAKLATNQEGFQAFNDLTLDTPDGTTQIDHVIISHFGIFVIETKNFKGWIYGSINQKQWTQTIYGKKYRFQNPLHQNYKHIKSVQNLLGVKQNIIFSIVVFVGKSQFKTKMPSNVVDLRDLLPLIRSRESVILSGNDIEAFPLKLNNPVYFDSSNNSKHIKNIQNNLQNPVCPRYGKVMIQRTARKGRSSGSKFWGCSGFLVCKATKRIA